MSNRFNLAEYLGTFQFANSLSSDLLTNSLTAKTVTLLNDYENFQGHVFFGNALRKSTVVINEIIDNYPIGINGTYITGLSADKVAEYENWSLSADGFSKFALNFICGATSNNLFPTITASATSYHNNEIVSLNIIERDSSNNILNADCSTNITNFLEAASLFDEGIARIKITSGTGSNKFVIPTFDTEIIDYIIPEKIRVAINRNMSLEKYMTNQTPFFIKDDEVEIFQRLVCIIADFFDSIKEYIDQFSNIFNFQYSGTDRAPEGLIQYMVAKQFGLELFEGAIAGNLPEYFIKSGKKGLQKITTQIWNRILNDINSLYKGKGTRFAFNQLLRNFGFYEGFMTVKEYVDNLETGSNTYEKNLNVKLPQFGSSGFNVFKVAMPSVTGVNVGTVMFQVTMPNIEDYVGGEFQIANIFNNRLVYDSTLRKYRIYPAYNSITSVFDVYSTENEHENLNGYIQNTMTPFIFSISSYGGTSNSNAIINLRTSDSLTGSFTTSSSTAYTGLSVGTLNFGSNTGNYFYSNVKFFRDRILTDEYLRNPHLRFNETNLIFDYKLYDIPTSTALNSFIGSLTSQTITSSTGSLTGGTSAYDIWPINIKRDWESSGIIQAGGDLIIDGDSKRTGSNNLGIGMFISEGLNNDILDYYTSSSAVNISSLYLDPKFYYSLSGDKRKWEHLENQKGLIFNQTRYPGGIQYTKFLKLIYTYRYILSNFFNTMDQFLRFKSKIVQKGINIEGSFLERDREKITSDLDEQTNTETTFDPITYSITSFENRLTTITGSTIQRETIVDNQSYGAFDYTNILSGTGFNHGTMTLSAINHHGALMSSVSSSSLSTRSVSVSGFRSLSGTKSTAFQQGITGTQIYDIGYLGISNTPKFSNTISVSANDKNSISSIITVNKNVLETSESIFIPLSGYIDLVYFPTSRFIGVGTVLRVLFNRSSYLSGIKILSSFTASPTASFSGMLYFVSTYNGTMPITGTLTATTFSSNTAVGLFNAILLKNNFKDIGVDTEVGYYRKYAKINLKVRSNTDYLKVKSNTFEINNPIDPITNLPIFNFYCFNNNKYYTDDVFNLPLFSKKGVDLLLGVNPIFNNINKGKQTVKIFNKLNLESTDLDFNVLNDSSDYSDSSFTQFTSESTNEILSSVTASSSFELNTQAVTLSAANLSSSSLVFGTTTAIDTTKGLMVFLNGSQQDENVFWTYTYSSTNNLFFNPTSLTAGDIISLFYYY